MDSVIQKNLLEGWFPLGDYPAPTDNGYVLLDPETEEKRNKVVKTEQTVTAKTAMLLQI